MKKYFFILFIFSFYNLSCIRGSFSTELGSVSAPTKEQTPNPDAVGSDFQPLAWDSAITSGPAWSKMIYLVIQGEELFLTKEKNIQDMALFCPKYDLLNTKQKMNFWAQLIVAVARFESRWNPTARYVETTMGNDPVTGEQVASEGLLQMSYQDVVSYNKICDFDWTKDKDISHKNPNDPRKTIFDPFKNLRCGVRVLARQIKTKHSITLDAGAYWAVLKKNGAHEKIQEISAMTLELNFCTK